MQTDKNYISRAGDKLASVVDIFKLDFRDKSVLDVGSSTGGFTDFTLQNGANKVVAVEKGSKQLHDSLRADPRVELHENTDIRAFKSTKTFDIIVIDVSFVSLREILPKLVKFCSKNTQIVAMVKPQFEALNDEKNKGIIKNEKIRREIFKSFESWAKNLFVVASKADSKTSGLKGNRERFYLLHKL